MEKKFRLFLLLALLMTAATGAWGMQIYISYPSWPTGTDVNGDGNLVLEMEASDSFENMKAKIEDKSGLNPTYMKLYFNSVEMANNETLNAKGVTSNSVLTLVYTLYNVTMKDGVKDADKWTITPAEATTTGVAEGTKVTLQYTGRLKVKSVTATTDAKPAAPSVPDGALSGNFSVSDTKQVYFSKGNLRYASGAWSFFDNQYDYYASYSADAWDKFGWSTSATTYGMNTSDQSSDYSGDFVDWGATMGTGWFTLTSDEWTYLFNTRTVNGGTGSGKSYTLDQSVNGKLGVVIYPDNYTGEVYSGSDWATFESAGCVFLPAAGFRSGTSVYYAGDRGYYWSSSPGHTNDAYRVYFTPVGLYPADGYDCCVGFNVRLVCEVATSDAAPAEEPVTLATPLTIEAITAGSIYVKNLKEGMQFSLDGGATKTPVTTDAIPVAAGDKVQFYGKGTSITSYGSNVMTECTTINGRGDGFTCKVYGNIMSLVDEENFATATTLSDSYTFKFLFYNNTKLTDANGLLLPATTLQASCYYAMFSNCSALTAAPALPATQLAEHCYNSMFNECYALTAAPVLPAKKLVNRCYYSMFNLCQNLATVTCLATSGINQDSSTSYWLNDAGSAVQGTKTVYTVSKDNWPSDFTVIPNGWTLENIDN